MELSVETKVLIITNQGLLLSLSNVHQDNKVK